MFKWLIAELFTPEFIEVRRVRFPPGSRYEMSGGMTVMSGRFHCRMYLRKSLFGIKWWTSPTGSWDQNLEIAVHLTGQGVPYSDGLARIGETYDPRKNK